MGDGRRRTVEWEPRSAAELTTRRRRVKPVEWPDLPFVELFFGVATVAMPLLLLFGTPGPAGRGIIAALVFFLGSGAMYIWSRRGIYLSLDGVTVQRGVLPRDPIPWSDVDRFELVRRRVPLDPKEHELVALVTVRGEIVPSWLFERDPEFEAHRLPVESAKAFLRSLPDLVERLNRITAEVRAHR